MKKQYKIRITERDLEILSFINDFGFCSMLEIDGRFGLKLPRNYQIINRLVKADLLRHERIFHFKHGIYYLTQKGAQYTKLPPLYRLSLANYKHDISVIKVYLKLRALYPEAQWISERQLKHDKYFDGVGKKGHLPDGMLQFPTITEGKTEKKLVAIEVELTAKNKKRVERILNGYGVEFSIEEVWYYCARDVTEFMRANTVRMSFVKVRRLEELLGD